MLRLQFSTLAWCGLALAVLGCGGRIGESDDVDAGVGDAVDASDAVLPDAAAPPPFALDATTPLPPSIDASVDADMPMRFATVYGETLVAGGASLATAEFSSVVATPPVCSLSTPRGSCAVATCGYAAADPSENAGSIVVSDGTQSATLVFSSTPPSTYDTWQGGAAGWSAPSTLTFSAMPSDALPAGLSKSLPFPAATTLTTPHIATMGAIATSTPLALAWSPVVSGEVVFVVEAVLPNDASHYAFLACVFDGALGSAAVPASLLAEMKSTAAGSTNARGGFLTLNRMLDVEQGWAIELAAFGPGGGYGPVRLD